MQYRTLGNTGFVVSVVGVGTWQFGGEWGKDFEQTEVEAMFDAARRLGINLIDTAECYGDHTSEALIGDAIARDRGRWIVCSKFGHKFLGRYDRTVDFSAAGMVKQLEASLKALRTDYMDVLQAHGVTQETFDDDALWSELEKQKRAGKIRAIGVSIGHDAMPLGKESVESVQVIYNRLNQGATEGVLPEARRKNLGVLSRVPLASGFLSGKYKPGQRWAEEDVRHKRNSQAIDDQLSQVERIAQEEVPQGVPMAGWALSWCLRHPAVTCVIPGCKSVAQVESNAAAAELDIGQPGHPQEAETPEG